MDFIKKIFSIVLAFLKDNAPVPQVKKDEGSVLGVLPDDRTEEEKSQDYHISEVVSSSASVVWEEKKPEEIRKFQVQDQKGKSDCVAESRRKLYHMIFWVNRGLLLDFSSVELYRRRPNYPAPGMGATDVMTLCRDGGMTLNVLAPSDEKTTEAEANALILEQYNVDIAKVFTISNEIVFTRGDVETPAGTIQRTRKGVMAWYYFTAEEWSREVPELIADMKDERDPRALRHSIVLVEPALYQGKKGFWMEDSAHFAGISRRFITEEFHRRRNIWQSYPINFKFEKGSEDDSRKPRYVENDTRSLQNCLKWEGVFAVNIESTGVFGPITIRAVKDFQIKYGLEAVGKVGPQTAAKLKTLYP